MLRETADSEVDNAQEEMSTYSMAQDDKDVMDMEEEDASKSSRVPAAAARKVGAKIRQKIKTLDLETSDLTNANAAAAADAEDKDECWRNDKNMNRLHEIHFLEREHSFETIQRKWEEITNSQRHSSSSGGHKVKVLVKPRHRQWASQTICSECLRNATLMPNSSVNIIMIKEAQEGHENEHESVMNVAPSTSNSKTDLGVNTELPQRASIGINTDTSKEDEIKETELRSTTSSRLSLLGGGGRKSSVSRIPVPINSPRKLVFNKRSGKCKHEEKVERVPPIISDSDLPLANPKRPSDRMELAMKIINDALLNGNFKGTLSTSKKIILQEWFSVAGTKTAHPVNVKNYLDRFKSYSPQLLRYAVNLSDEHGITALHYAASYEKFGVIALLLDTNICDPNKANKAGYNCVMLASLAHLRTEKEENTIRRLFSMGDVNTKSSQHGQTPLMLASAHGRFECAKLLVESGADLNMQDEDGSTALMCAAEHGHVDIVQYLLAQRDCDPHIVDNDGITALTVAMDAGHKDIAVLLYAHMHFTKTPKSSLGSGLSSPCGHSVLAKRSVSTIVKSKHSKSSEKQGTLPNVARKQQSSIN